MIENLLWEKYRPKTLDDLILLPRIRKLVSNGIDNNLILYGHFGMGKSSLARILTQGKSSLYRNTSLHTSIDVLREDVSTYVNTMSDIFTNDLTKYVFLDEFEEASSKYQNALKAFMEEEHIVNKVRFIFSTNHIHKVEKGILSRCTKLDFNPSTDEEIKYWKTECKNKLIDIAEKEKIKISELDIKRIVNHNFPDLRQMTVILSEVKRTGTIDYSISTFDSKLKNRLYNDLKTSDTIGLQKFIMDNFGPEKVQEMLNLCGRPLLEILITKDKDIIKTDKLGDIMSIVAEHSMWLNTIKGGDPVVVGTSCLHNIQKIIK
jgi:replication-associated recombination protein RarA